MSGCKMVIRGKGSVKLKPGDIYVCIYTYIRPTSEETKYLTIMIKKHAGETEAALVQQQQHQHLVHPLHVVVEWEGAISGKDDAFLKVRTHTHTHTHTQTHTHTRTHTISRVISPPGFLCHK